MPDYSVEMPEVEAGAEEGGPKDGKELHFKEVEEDGENKDELEGCEWRCIQIAVSAMLFGNTFAWCLPSD